MVGAENMTIGAVSQHRKAKTIPRTQAALSLVRLNFLDTPELLPEMT